MPGLIRRLWRVAAGLLAVVVILAAVLVGLARLALVQVPEYRDQIESWAGEALGWPVEIGAMDARLGWHGPELRFTNARVLTRDRERTMVVAASGSMQFERMALLRGKLRPGAVSLAGVALRIERSVKGRWRLLGEAGPLLGDDTPTGEADAELPLLEALPAARLRLEDLQVEYEDLRRGVGPWEFQADMLVLQLGNGRAELTTSGRLPDALGEEFALSAVVTGQDVRGRPRDWSAGASFAALDLHALDEMVGFHRPAPDAGMLTGSISAEVDASGLGRVAGDVLARDLRLPRPTEGAHRVADRPFDFLGAAFEWTRTADGWHARVNNLDVERAGRRWASAAALLAFERNEAERRIEVRADHLELEDLAPLARWLPPDTRTLVEQLAPAGAVRELEAHLDLPADRELTPDIYVDAHFERLTLEPSERTPGIRNISGTVSGDLYRGSARLDAREAEVALPRLFRAPLPLASAGATVEWTRDDQAVRLQVSEFSLANDDAAVSGHAALTIPADSASPHLEIDAVARDVRLVAAPAYLPVGIMRDKVVAWLDDALKAGSVAEARLKFDGATRSFPFRDGDGLFKVEFEIADGELNFQPGWPNATGLDAAVRFENEGLWAEVRGARLLDVEAGPATAAIPDLAQGMLAVAGAARGELADFREVVLAAELLRNILGPGLEPAEFSAGEVTADVDLSLPLRDLAEYRAQVELRVDGGVAAYGFLGEPLRDIDAHISIDNARVTARGAEATLAGRPVVADVVVDEHDAIRVEGRGRLDVSGLARVLRVPVDAWAEGESDWAGHLQFPAPGAATPLELQISSRLEGIAIDLPEPFLKAAGEARSLQVRARFPRPDLMDLDLEWDESLQIAAHVDRSGPEAVLAPVPGAVAGDPAGLVFSGAINRLDLGAWLQVEVPGEIKAGGFPAIAGGRLLVGELSAPMIGLRDALLELSRSEDDWQLELASEDATGKIAIPYKLYGDRPVTVRLDRLWLDAGRGRPPAKDIAPEALHPARVPPLDVQIDDVRYGDIRFGSVSARVLHEGDGIELIGLEGIGGSFYFQAEGRSRLSGSVDESRLGVSIRSDNVGATLEYMGFRRGMEASNGKFEAEVRWQGGLRSDWLSAIEGDATIVIRDGKLVGVEPGAGRMFGLLSIQALPRRLALDFKDVFGEGTAFDRISGDFRFAGGHAFTENLVMRGPAAEMGVIGRTGLVARDYDQTAVIGADLGRTLPVAGAVVGGPAVGAALYVLSELLRKPFQTHITYRLTGSWDNPVIERLTAGSTVARPGDGQAPGGDPTEEQPEEPPEEQRGPDAEGGKP